MDNLRIHNDTIEELKQRLDIVDIVSEVVVLKKSGKDYTGLCPFHQEKSPSFSVSPNKQMYYCFGCQAGGNAIKFLMESRKQSFTEVVLDLCRRYQISVKTLNPEQRQEFQRQLTVKEQLYEIMAVAVNFYHHALYQSQGEQALSYLKEKRGLDDDTIKAFQLGYAPGGWETIFRYLVEQKHYPLGLVQQSGLIKPRSTGNGHYDMFRERVMIPINDSSGRAIAFGSRTLGDDTPKYLNSPDTPLFEKGKTLFALDKAKAGISKNDRAIIVEGYFDAIALHRAGINTAVASLGTALGEGQVRQVIKYTNSKEIIFNFDSDKAGVAAAQRAISEISSLVNSGQIAVKILTLPSGKDADEFLQSQSNGVEVYKELVQKAPLWIDWQIGQFLLDRNLKKADGFQSVSKQMLQLLRQLEDSNQQLYYLRHCAEILAGGDGRAVMNQMEILRRQLRQPIGKICTHRPVKPSAEDNLGRVSERFLLQVYLHCPEYRSLIVELLEDKDLAFGESDYREVWQKIREVESTITDPQRLAEITDNRLSEFPQESRAAAELFKLSEQTQEDLANPGLKIRQAVVSLEQLYWETNRRYCLQQCQNLLNSPEKRNAYHERFVKAQSKIDELQQLRCQDPQ
ncbi:MAG: DNA primase [Chroococcopsis gigantea SAG 12.99]|jgi:DNA primase|nr:DNA primase [Chroococcopsis gigantea SAG 12.99]